MAISFDYVANRISRQPRRVNHLFTWIVLSTTLVVVLTSGSADIPPAIQFSPQMIAKPAGAEFPVSTILTPASGETIRFLTQNGQIADGNPPQILDLPHLVLHRNGRLTAVEERTLLVTISNLVIQQPGAMVSLDLSTVHPDPDGSDDASPVLVKRMTTWTTSTPVTLTVTFGETYGDAVDTLATPTDYYNLALAISSRDGHVATIITDYALLLEDQWVVPLPAASEQIAGAAPDSMVVYYCDMVPFQHMIGDPNTRLARSEVEAFVGTILVPNMVEAFRLQSNEWGFTWHKAWTGCRGGADAERLSVALTDGRTWFHEAAPSGASSLISINVNAGLSGSYATLADGIVSVFHHELFHNLQSDLRHTLAGHADVDGPADAWAFITEGMAVAAQSVARPDLEYGPGSESRAFYSRSNAFLHGTDRADDKLNTSYNALNPYQGALYWRFLFEAAGGLEDPAAGMTALRNILEVLYSGDVVDIETSDDLVRYLPDIVTQGLARTPTSPFQSYQKSLHSFARSIYKLRLEHSGALYDPNHLLATPAAELISYPSTFVHFDPQRLPEGHGIASSFGIDFIEVWLDADVQRSSLVLEIRGATGGSAEFDVQMFGIDAEGRIKTAVSAPGRIVHTRYNNTWITSPTLNAAGDELAYAAVIIVRVDNQEKQDSVGRYTLRIYPAPTVASD